MKFNVLSIVFVALFVSVSQLFSQVPAFPGAEGYGANVTGGRGGKVIYVTNLNDSGDGSLRAAIEETGPRIVMFKVSGTIELQSGLKIKNPDITIAGQTAPGDGICIANYPVYFEGSSTNYKNGNPDEANAIIRYMRFRLGDQMQTEDDAFKGRRVKNVIVDHCSVSWSVDECASFYDNQNFTMQYCILSESLYKSVHDKGNHGYGGIWGGQGVSYHHNLLAHHTSRNPRFCGSRYSNAAAKERIDHRNNVIYNWGGNSCYGAEGGSYNIVNNYYKPGPATSSGASDRIIAPNADDGKNSQAKGVWGKFHIEGNYVEGFSAVTSNNWNGVDPSTSNGGFPGGTIDGIKSLELFDGPDYTEHSAEEAYLKVLAYAGAIFPKRDSIDQRIIEETRTGTATYGASYGAGTGIIDTQTDVGGYITYNSTTAPTDTDGDGMPDDWEDANSLNKAIASDGSATATNGYTNLENYLNGLVELPGVLFKPMGLTAEVIETTMNVKVSWEDINDIETGYVIERRFKDDDDFTEIETVQANISSFIDETVPGYGSYYYRIKAITATEETDYTGTVRVYLEEPEGLIGYKPEKIKLMVGPNPCTDHANIYFKLDRLQNVTIALVDLTGKTIQNIEHGMLYEGEHRFNVQTNKLSNGIYFLKLVIEESQYNVRLVVNN